MFKRSVAVLQDTLWLGGGHVDLKVCVNTAAFVKALDVLVAPVTNPRGE